MIRFERDLLHRILIRYGKHQRIFVERDLQRLTAHRRRGYDKLPAVVEDRLQVVVVGRDLDISVVGVIGIGDRLCIARFFEVQQNILQRECGVVRSTRRDARTRCQYERCRRLRAVIHKQFGVAIDALERIFFVHFYHARNARNGEHNGHRLCFAGNIRPVVFLVRVLQKRLRPEREPNFIRAGRHFGAYGELQFSGHRGSVRGKRGRQRKVTLQTGNKDGFGAVGKRSLLVEYRLRQFVRLAVVRVILYRYARGKRSEHFLYVGGCGVAHVVP